MTPGDAFPESQGIEKHEPMPSLYGKLLNIMNAADFIAKDKTNEAQKYSYASEEAIKTKMHALLVEHRVLFIPSTEIIETHAHTVQGRDGQRTVLLTTIQGTATFIDVDSGERLPVRYVGTGADSMDKGAYKAITGALKYVLTGSFLIPTGSDPEGELAKKTTTTQARQYDKANPKKDQDAYIGMNDQKALHIFATKEGLDAKGFKQWLFDAGFVIDGAGSTKAVKVSQLEDVKERVKRFVNGQQ